MYVDEIAYSQVHALRKKVKKKKQIFIGMYKYTVVAILSFLVVIPYKHSAETTTSDRVEGELAGIQRSWK